MSKSLAELVNGFHQLSEEERTQFRDLIMHSSGDGEMYGEITDEDIDAMGVESFRRLDEEENAANARRSVEG